MKIQSDYSSKPYNRCLSCPHRKVRCDGPRTSGLSLQRWKEYMRDMKEINGLTNAIIAEESGLPVKTIERALSPTSTQDIMRETTMLIENVIVGSTSKYPCYLAFEEENGADQKKFNDAMRDLERALNDNADYRKALEGIHDSYNAELTIIRDEAQRKIDFLLGQLKQLRIDNDNLWAENNRKSKLIDHFIEQKAGIFISKE